MKRVSNWGNTPEINAKVIPFHTSGQLKAAFQQLKELIPRGMGRCYGDSALNNTIISTTEFNRILSFDNEKGVLVCQSGITLESILDYCVPLGWFLPVTPGTKFVTIGGAVAANVHGKNHHVHGSISQYLEYVDVLCADGDSVRCSREKNQDLFNMTCGGMGLTGVILQVSLKLIKIESAYIKQRTLKTQNLNEVMDFFESYHDVTYSVAWIDCLAKGVSLGKSVLMLGEHAHVSELPIKKAKKPFSLPKKGKKRLPFFLPNFVLNTFTVKLFNFFYYVFSPRSGSEKIVDYDTYFYPLDHIQDWNKGYGKRGFTQYQCVFPLSESKVALTELLTEISNSGQGSFLAVLKRFGKESGGGLSFPMEGYSLALDFPMTPNTLMLMDKLDGIVQKYKGRLYLAKDSRMSDQVFEATYSESDTFKQSVKQIDAQQKFSSLQSRRLKIKD